MKVEMRKLSAIRPYEGNPRHNDAAVDAVAASIKEFGFRQPLVLDEQDEIVVGDTRSAQRRSSALRKCQSMLPSG